MCLPDKNGWRYTGSDSSYDDDFDGEYILVEEERYARWDKDYQAKYLPPTRYQDVVMTAKRTWEDLCWESIKKSVEVAAGGVMKKSVEVVKASKKEVAVAVNEYEWSRQEWKPPKNAFNIKEEDKSTSVQGKPYWKSRGRQTSEEFEEETLKAKYGWGMVGQDGAEIEVGPRFVEDEEYFDPLGVSGAWKRQVKKEDQMEVRKLKGVWEAKEEKSAPESTAEQDDDGKKHPSPQYDRKDSITRRITETLRIV